jgi:uncharacterized protein (TIGR02246 family)
MRNLRFAALLPALTVSYAAQAQTGPAEVRRAIANMNVAASKLDADTFMVWYWNSSSLVITFDGEVMRGWQNILAAQRGWWSDKKSGVRFTEAREPEIVSQGHDVITTIQWMNVADPKSASPSKLIITSVWRKRAEGWRIVLAHESLVPPSQ